MESGRQKPQAGELCRGVIPCCWLGVPARQLQHADAEACAATLFTPPNYDKDRDGRLPCLVWAYPREFKSKVGVWPKAFQGVGYRI